MRLIGLLGAAGCLQDLEPALLNCASAIDDLDEVPDGYLSVLDAVALGGTTADTQPLNANGDIDGRHGARFYSKTGLLVRSGLAARLVVPDGLRKRLSIGWGTPSPRTWDLSIPACDGASTWLAFAGGYTLGEVGCYRLLVRTGDNEQAVDIAIGGPCEPHP